MDISNLINGAIGNTIASSLSNKLNIDAGKAKWLIGAAVPLMIAGLNYNAKQKNQAKSIDSALDQHSGNILGNLSSVLSGGATADGGKIVGHIFGNNTDMVTTGLSRKSGLSTGQVSGAMAMLAPILMGVLGQQKKSTGGGVGDLIGGLLGGGKSSGGLGGALLGSVLGGGKSSGGLGGALLGSVLGGGKKSAPSSGMGGLFDLAGDFFNQKNAPAKQDSALDALTGLFGL